MTNKMLDASFFRIVGLPAALLFLGFSCYCLFDFWQQEAVAKELYTWEPVWTTDYEIRVADQPKWPIERPSANSEEYAEWLEQLRTMENTLYTTEVNEYSIEIRYRYEYQGVARGGVELSPFSELNKQALRNPQLHRYLLREDHPPLTVYVNPDDPERSALMRGWAQGNRWGALVLGGVLLPLSLSLLYFLVRPVRKVEELFETRVEGL
ncbi:MAG: DUF3592 domain-containing protein [Lewinella sp.]